MQATERKMEGRAQIRQPDTQTHRQPKIRKLTFREASNSLQVKHGGASSFRHKERDPGAGVLNHQSRFLSKQADDTPACMLLTRVHSVCAHSIYACLLQPEAEQDFWWEGFSVVAQAAAQRFKAEASPQTTSPVRTRALSDPSRLRPRMQRRAGPSDTRVPWAVSGVTHSTALLSKMYSITQRPEPVTKHAHQRDFEYVPQQRLRMFCKPETQPFS